MLRQTLYTAEIHAAGGRDGHVESADGNLKTRLSTPPGMGGTGGPGTNPEQLFGAAYAACFGGSINYLAAQKAIDTGEVTVQARVGIGPSADKPGFEIAAALEVTLPKLSQPDAEALVAEAHRICPYSNATRGNVEVTLKARGGVGVPKPVAVG